MPRRLRRLPLSAVALVAALALAGCSTASDASGIPAAPDSDTLSGELAIFAAASLSTAFDELAAQFEDRHPGVDVRPVSYDGSSTLATQLVEGAPADVFASADESTMQRVVDAGLVDDPALFASNTLVLAVPTGNPGAITSLDDLAGPGLTVVLCAEEVPCGAASRTLLSNAGVSVTPASLEQNVTAVLTKVAAGEAEAGLVYATDVAGRDDVEAIVPDGASEVVNRYPIGVLRDAANPEVAAAFTAFVLSADGQAVLARFGFGAP